MDQFYVIQNFKSSLAMWAFLYQDYQKCLVITSSRRHSRCSTGQRNSAFFLPKLTMLLCCRFLMFFEFDQQAEQQWHVQIVCFIPGNVVISYLCHIFSSKEYTVYIHPNSILFTSKECTVNICWLHISWNALIAQEHIFSIFLIFLLLKLMILWIDQLVLYLWPRKRATQEPAAIWWPNK
jgi:hypothetical protein